MVAGGSTAVDGYVTNMKSTEKNIPCLDLKATNFGDLVLGLKLAIQNTPAQVYLVNMELFQI